MKAHTLIRFVCLCAVSLSAGTICAVEPVERHVGPMLLAPSDSLTAAHGFSTVKSYGFEASLEIEGMRTSRDLGTASWWIDWLDADSVPYMRVSLRWGNGLSDDPSFDTGFLQVSAVALPSGELLASRNLSKGVSLSKGANTLMADWDGNLLGIYVGNDRLREACVLPDVPAPAMVVLKANKPVKLDYFAARFIPAPSLPVMAPVSLDSVMASLPVPAAGTSSPVGMWEFLDRDTDGVRSQIGGYYALAVLPHAATGMHHVASSSADGTGVAEEPLYDICYIGGAKVNAAEWERGMLKGYLYATPFVNHYRLVWYDALKEDMGAECFADLADNALLTVSFPLHAAKMRFARRP